MATNGHTSYPNPQPAAGNMTAADLLALAYDSAADLAMLLDADSERDMARYQGMLDVLASISSAHGSDANDVMAYLMAGRK